MVLVQDVTRGEDRIVQDNNGVGPELENNVRAVDRDVDRVEEDTDLQK
jgi:hypothetical protein